MIEQEVKSIAQTVLGDREMLCDLGVHRVVFLSTWPI
jgi:hypothetical protein